MYGGTIRNCTGGHFGGGAVGLYTSNKGRFIMDGGTITNCTAEGSGYGGAIFSYTTEGYIELNGGTVTNNNAVVGGGVFVYNGTAKVSDKIKIYNNHASAYADDIYKNKSAILELGNVSQDGILDCGHKVNAWYIDPSSERWNVAVGGILCSSLSDSQYISTMKPQIYEAKDSYSLKAAHGRLSIVTIDKCDGSEKSEVFVNTGACIKVFSDLDKRTGYTFKGWYTKTDGEFDEEPFDFSNPITQDIQLYAKWEESDETDEDKEQHSNVGNDDKKHDDNSNDNNGGKDNSNRENGNVDEKNINEAVGVKDDNSASSIITGDNIWMYVITLVDAGLILLFGTIQKNRFQNKKRKHRRH